MIRYVIQPPRWVRFFNLLIQVLKDCICGGDDNKTIGRGFAKDVVEHLQAKIHSNGKY